MRLIFIYALLLCCLAGGCRIMHSTPVVPDTAATDMRHSSAFVSDVNIPDGSVMEPERPFRKTWRVRNDGSSSWAGVKLVFIHGQNPGGPLESVLPEVKPGDDCDISLDLTAPASPGPVMGYWRMVDPRGRPFGDTLWLHIVVNPDQAR